MRVVMLEEGEHHATDDFTARPREMTARLYRDAGMTATVGNTPIVLPLGRGIGGHDDDQLRHLLPHAAAGAGDVAEPLRPRAADARRARPLLPPRRAHHQRRPGPARAGRPQRPGRQARRRRARLVERLHLPQRPRLRRLGRVRVRLPDVGQAVGQPELRAARLGGGRDDLHGHDGRRTSSWPATAPARSTPRTTGGGRLRDRDRHRHRRLPAPSTRRCFLQPQRPRPALRRARRQPRHPPGHGGPRAVRDEEIDMARGVPQSLYIDEFADERIMFEGAAGPPDYLAMTMPFSRERHRDLMLRFQQLQPVRRDGQRPVARPRARALRPARDPLRPERRGRRRVQARHRAALTELYWEAGAHHCLPADRQGRRAERRRHDARCSRPTSRPSDLTLMAFHPLGTARADARARPRRRRRRPEAARRRRRLRGRRLGRPELAGRQPADHDHGAGHAAGLPAARQAARRTTSPSPSAIARPRIERAHAITA